MRRTPSSRRAHGAAQDTEKAASVTSWFSKFLRKESSAGLAQQVRMRITRFRHLLRLYGRMTALGADAAEKQSGEFILDGAYILALCDKAFDTVGGMVYDLNVLTGRQHIGLYAAVEDLHEKSAKLLRSGPRASRPSSVATEEPEYRLLREVRETLFQAGDSMAPPTTLGSIAESAVEAAADSLAGFARILKSIPSTDSPAGGRLPVRASVVDLMDSLTEADKLQRIPDPLSADSGPTHDFLTAFFAPQFWSDWPHDSAPLQSAGVVAVGLEDSMNATVFHREGYEMLDAYLSCTPDSNHIYFRFSSEAAPSAVDGILARLGFSVSRTPHGVTGWLALQPLDAGTARLKAIGKMAAFFLQSSPSGLGSGGAENDVARFFQVHV
jgi:hypothetical protein